MIGLALGAASIVLDYHDAGSWGITIYTITTGVLAAIKRPIGTAMLAIGLIGLLGYRAANLLRNPEDWSMSFYDGIRLLLGVAWYGSMVAAVLAQVSYFRKHGVTGSSNAEQGAAGQPATAPRVGD